MARDEALLALVSTTTDETYSSRIFRQLEFLLSELSLNLSQFDLFAVNAGPGSFTGLRVGLTTAKAWAEAFSKPVVAVSGLEAIASQATGVQGSIISVTDARRGQLYVGLYKRSADGQSTSLERIQSSEDRVTSPEEFLAWLAGTPGLAAATLATPSAAWLQSVLAPHEAQRSVALNIREVSPVLAPPIATLAYQRAQRRETVDALRLDANYVRRSDAELSWKEK